MGRRHTSIIGPCEAALDDDRCPVALRHPRPPVWKHTDPSCSPRDPSCLPPSRPSPAPHRDACRAAARGRSNSP
jgi:hypothetical protein